MLGGVDIIELEAGDGVWIGGRAGAQVGNVGSSDRGAEGETVGEREGVEHGYFIRELGCDQSEVARDMPGEQSTSIVALVEV